MIRRLFRGSQITSRPVGVDLGVTDETEVRTSHVVRDDVSVLLRAVIPEHDGFVDLTRNGQLDLAVALASGRCFEFCNALFEIRAAVTMESYYYYYQWVDPALCSIFTPATTLPHGHQTSNRRLSYGELSAGHGGSRRPCPPMRP